MAMEQQRPLYVQSGDTFFTRSNSVLGRLIRWGQTEKGEEPAWTNHTGVVVKEGWVKNPGDLHQPEAEVVEALWHTREGVLKLNGNKVRVFRPVPRYDDVERARMIAEAKAHVGENYGWWKLLGFLAKRFTGVDVPKLFFVKSRPICSFLAALANDAARRRSAEWPGFGMPPQAADPDEMLDFCEKSPYWQEVH